MKTLLIVISVFLFTGCAGRGVVSIPTQVINDSSLTSMSKKYVDAVCSEQDVRDEAHSPADCKNIGDIKANSWLDTMQKCQSMSSDNTKCVRARNSIANELLLIIDHNYLNYEGNLLAGKAIDNFVTETIRTTFETAATLFTPASTVKLLSGAALFTGSIQSSAEKEFYFENTIGVLIIQMRADRKKELLFLLTGLGEKNYIDYPLERAIGKLNDYYRAGTLASSIVSLSSVASNKESEAAKDIECLQIGKNCPSN